MKYIYIYTTSSYVSKNWYKVGETIVDPEQRVKSQDNASNPEPLIFVHAWLVPNHLTDKKVHIQLEKLNFNRIRREWFELSDTPKEDVKQAILQITPLVEEFQENTQTFLSTIPIKNYTEMWWFQRS